MSSAGSEFEAEFDCGQGRCVAAHSTPLANPNGGAAGWVLLLLDVSERKAAEANREELVTELQAALNRVKMLSGLLPICANCKRIRDDTGDWIQVETFVRDHSEAEFSHGICPQCIAELYPEFYKSE
jgi:hypothetical protein